MAILRVLAAILAVAVTVGVALRIDAMPSTLPPLAWMALAAVSGLVAALAIPLLLEDLVHRQVRRLRPEAGRQRALAIVIVDAAFAFLLVRFAGDDLLQAIGQPPRAAASASPATSASGAAASSSGSGASGSPSASGSPGSPSASGSSGASTPAPSGVASVTPPSGSSSAHASVLAPAAADLSAEDLFDARADTVVVLQVRSSAAGTGLDVVAGARVAVARGSGFVVDPAGLVVTNEHVIHGGEAILARLRDGRSFGTVKILAVDVERDLALLELPARGLAAAPLAEADPRVGARALAIGSPKGLEYTLTDGIVSAFRERGPTKLLQFQTTIAPGSSGGPLFDTRGRVIGVTTETQGAGLNAAVRIEHVKQLLAGPRTPRELASWGGQARLEELHVEGPPLGPTDRGNLEDALRGASTLLEPCLRDPGPEKASMNAGTTWPPGGVMQRLSALREIAPTTDLTGPPGECLARPGRFFFTQIAAQLAGIVPVEHRGKVVVRFRLTVPGPAGAGAAPGRSLDVRLDIDA